MHHHAASSHTSGSHSHATPVATTGHLIHWSLRYDWLVQAMVLGRAGQLRKRMADLIPLQAGNVVLDIGCGTGDLAFQLAKRVGISGKVMGIDPSPEMIDRAQHKARRRQLAIDFQVAAAEALPFPAHTFDYVVSTLVFHHLPGELKTSALTAIAQVLKPTGQVLIVDFLPSSSPTLTHNSLRADAADLPALLRATGFEVVRSGHLPFRAIGMPPLGFVVAQNTRSS